MPPGGKPLAEALERLYLRYNVRGLVEPDPLQFLYSYDAPADREIAGLVASGLAYGRVEQITTSVGRVLEVLGPAPSAFLAVADRSRLSSLLGDFKHRFTTGEEMAAFLAAVHSLQAENGGSVQCMFSGAGSLLEAMETFAREVISRMSPGRCTLLPLPSCGSACKRLNLFLRWMVRCDEVDPGGWTCLSPSELLVPLDVHMHRAGLALGMTSREQGDMRTVLEITEGFRKLRPDDPVRYDFAITRFGIRRELTPASLMAMLGRRGGSSASN